MTHFIYNDGGRAAAGYKGDAGDCVTRAIAIATGKPYQEVYDSLHKLAKAYASEHRDRTAQNILKSGGSPRDGVSRNIYELYLGTLGWVFKPTMGIGSGCKVHLRAEELPGGAVIARLSKHLAAVIDGVVQDTFDCTRGGDRCVYGYYYKVSKHA